jgi:flagellar biosynthesis GTPase FlhF
MEVGGTVSFTSGAMESLLAKLADGTTDTKTKSLGTAVMGLKNDLEFIRDSLQDFALMRERTLQAKQWMKQVRETVYDIEDWVDEHRADREAGDKHVGIVKGLVQMVKNMGASKDQLPSSQIKEFKELIKDANDRLKRYGLKRESSLPSNHHVLVAAADAEDNRVPALRVEETGLVGMESHVKSVLDQLVGDAKETHLKFTFLVGSGGLGKTTLAKQVWRWPGLQQQFELPTFVRAGLNPSAKTVLMSILDELKWQRPHGYESWNEQQVINELKKQLGGKK